MGKYFLDLLGLIGDYTAVTYSMDVMDHNSLVYCYLSVVRKYENYCNGRSNFKNYTAHNITKI